MKKKSNRRAFTIVELVIVIAVIAVLAAALLPAFGNMIESANNSKLMQEAKNAYTQYLIDHAVDGDDTEFAIFVSKGKFVSLQSGAPREVFDDVESALKDLFGDKADEYVGPNEDYEGLFICRILDSSDDDEKDEDDPLVDVNKDLNILAVGNSYTGNSLKYVEAIASKLGISITVNITESISDSDDAEDFDFVIFQKSRLVAVPANIPDGKLVLDMNDSYQAEIPSEFSKVIPTYTAKMNSQTSILGDNQEDSEYHCFLNSLIVVKTLTQKSVETISYLPNEEASYKGYIAIESVNNAVNDPSSKTNSQYVLSDDYEIIGPSS